MTSDETSPTPWSYEVHGQFPLCVVLDANRHLVASDVSIHDARAIVRIVNAHYSRANADHRAMVEATEES